jgi:hypothetical protein
MLEKKVKAIQDDASSQKKDRELDLGDGVHMPCQARQQSMTLHTGGAAHRKRNKRLIKWPIPPLSGPSSKLQPHMSDWPF